MSQNKNNEDDIQKQEEKKPFYKEAIFYIRLVLVLIIIGSASSIIYTKYHYYIENKKIEDLKKAEKQAEEKKQEEIEKEPEAEKPKYISPIDFDYWKKLNPDVIGYIKISGTKVDYPILWDGADNLRYLHTDINGKKSVHGSIYLDALANPDFTSLNNVIYGHHMRDGTMFKDVVKYKDKKYLEKHKKIKIYTPDREIDLVPVGAFYGKPEGYARKVDFSSEESFKKFCNDRLSHCEYKINPPKHITQLFCLVTCSYEFNDARTFLYCVKASDYDNDKNNDKNNVGNNDSSSDKSTDGNIDSQSNNNDNTSTSNNQ